MPRILLTLTVLAGCVGCGGAQGGPLSSQPTYETPLVGPCEGGDPLTLLRREQHGRQLLIEVRYTGGCEQHTFVACMEDPHPHEPQIYTLRINHNAQDDHCEAERYTVLEVALDRDIEAGPIEDGVIQLE